MKNSLKNKKDIDKLFSLGKTKVTNNIMLKTIDGTPGFITCVSSKNFKKAVDRNRIKRLMREELKGLTPSKSIAIIYIGKDVPKHLNFREYL